MNIILCLIHNKPFLDMNKTISLVLLLMASIFVMSCSKDDDNDNKVEPEGITVELADDSYTEDGYFDGSLYYRIISESAKTAAVAKADVKAKNVTIPAIIVLKGKQYTVTEIDEYAFAVGRKASNGLPTGNVESVTFPNTIKKSAYRAFLQCDKLKKTVANDLESWCRIEFDNSGNPLINGSGFFLKDGQKITKLEIPQSISKIRDYAFGGAAGITEVILHDNVKEIESNAFALMDNLKKVQFGAGLKTIGDYAFFACDNLGDIAIPDNVTSIEEDAFSDCKSITSFKMGEGVKKIEERTFFGCRSLKNIEIGKNVTEIEMEAFRSCDNLETIEIPDKVATVGSGVFTGCKKLKTITLPDAMRNFGHEVFAGCTALKTVNSHIKNPSKVSFFSYGEHFPNISTITLNVPVGTKDAYEALSPWNEFKTIVEKEGL